MLLLKALRNRAVFLLWLGQLGSSIGDEIYRMAFIWLSVSFIGADTGYLSALQFLAILGFGIFGSKWADRLSPYRTMIGVDLIRAVITLTPVVLYYLHRPSFVALVISAVFLSGLGAFFEPALQTILPIAAKDPVTLKAANGLMSTTTRLARVAGPALIGLLSAFVATIHFFTLNAFSYLISTFSLFAIRKNITHAIVLPHSENEHVFSDFLHSLKLLKTKRAVWNTLFAKTITGGAWSLIYGLGMALLVHEISPGNVKAFGLVMGFYGIGNVVGALVLANLERKNPEQKVYLGLTWLGVCFVLVSISKSFPLLLLMTTITAIGGPLNDISFTDLVQSEFKIHDLHKIFRLRLMFETFFSLVFAAVSPLLFHQFPIRSVICGAGVFIVFFGGWGLIDVLRRNTPS
jgi:DHA3 family macrolide efflux protein-like MFS transporter